MNTEGEADRVRLQQQRAMVRKAMGQGRRWWLRSVLMIAVAFWALWAGGSLNTAIAIAMIVLAAIAIGLGRQLRSQAAEIEKKLNIMEQR